MDKALGGLRHEITQQEIVLRWLRATPSFVELPVQLLDLHGQLAALCQEQGERDQLDALLQLEAEPIEDATAELEEAPSQLELQRVRQGARRSVPYGSPKCVTSPMGRLIAEASDSDDDDDDEDDEDDNDLAAKEKALPFCDPRRERVHGGNLWCAIK